MTVKTLGIIMDGNRRWALAKGLPKTDGHKHGLDTLVKCMEWCNESSIEHVVFYAFSTENWKRPKKEVTALMDLFEYMMTEKRKDIIKEGVRVRFIGEKQKFSKKIQKMMFELESETNKHTKTAWVCISYGGRAELVHAAASISGKPTEKKIENSLWSADLPDLDLIIRTGGDHRLSNFMLWKAAYAELYFIKTPWPGFTKAHFKKALDWYEKNVQVNNGK